jgi:hypothetical protein
MNTSKKYNVVWSLDSMDYVATEIEEGSPEDLATEDYYRRHDLLPKGYMQLSDEEVQGYGESLLKGRLSLSEKKKAIMVLAHRGGRPALEYLQLYTDIAEPELEGWMKLAIDECRMFTPQNRSQRRAMARWN